MKSGNKLIETIEENKRDSKKGPVEAPKIGSKTRGIPTRSGPWLAAPFPFGIVGPTRDMGPVSQYMCVCVEN